MNLLKDKSFAFAVRVINLYKYLLKDKNEFILSKQIMRSGTSIGANIREAFQAESEKDFIHKLSISLKEADESLYWLELLKATNYISADEFNAIAKDNIELLKLLTSSIKKKKNKGLGDK